MNLDGTTDDSIGQQIKVHFVFLVVKFRLSAVYLKPSLSAAGLERKTLDNFLNQCLESISGSLQVAGDLLYGSIIVLFQTPAQRICQHLLSQAAGEIREFFFKQNSKFGRAGKGLAIGKGATRVNREFAI